jgi:hypothetical protein
MHLPVLARNLLSAGLAMSAVGMAGADEAPHIQGFVEYCAYVGANLTGHWLGAFCRNNMTDVFGYNYTWYLTAYSSPVKNPCRTDCGLW